LVGSYGVRAVTGDRYAGEWPREQFRARGVSYEVAAKDRSQLYLDLLPAVNAGTVELPDVPDLLREMRGLERRRGPSGRDRVDHRPGSHDDLANAAAGVVSLLAGRDPATSGSRSARSGSGSSSEPFRTSAHPSAEPPPASSRSVLLALQRIRERRQAVPITARSLFRYGSLSSSRLYAAPPSAQSMNCHSTNS